MTLRPLIRHGAWIVVLLLAGCATTPGNHVALSGGHDVTQHFSLGLANSIEGPVLDDPDVFSGRGETRGALAGPALPPDERWAPTPPDISGFHQVGEASWYGKKFVGRRTASGERYDMLALTAAHRTLPLASYVRVTNPANGKSVVVRINDRGPFSGHRIIDLSFAAASALDLQSSGTGRVELAGLSAADAQAAQATQAAAVAQTGSGRERDARASNPTRPGAAPATDRTLLVSRQ